jgi:hypothetical protein
MADERPSLQNISQELRTPGYTERARQRAQRRKSPWNLVLIPLSIAGVGGSAYVLFKIMWHIHIALYPDHAGRFDEFWGQGVSFRSFVSSFLLLIPLLFAGLVIGLMFANCVAWCVVPARRAFDREAEGVKWASFRVSMRRLWVVARIIVPACLLLSFIGAATLRSLK